MPARPVAVICGTEVNAYDVDDLIHMDYFNPVNDYRLKSHDSKIPDMAASSANPMNFM